MKKVYSYLVVLLFMTISLNAQQKFTVKGKLTELKEPVKILLTYRASGKTVKDSVTTHASFEFKGEVDQPIKGILRMKPVAEHDSKGAHVVDSQQDFYLEKGTINITGTDNLKTASIKGGKIQGDYLALQKELMPLQVKMAPLKIKMRRYIIEKNVAAQNELLPQLSAILLEMGKVEDNFIYSHPDSYVSFDMVRNKGIVISDVKSFETFYNSLSQRFKNSEGGKKLAAKLAIAKKLEVGQPFINFTQNNTDGVPVTLASFKGKYVLLDFWASWCPPCRAENPNILKAYNKFKDKNFEVVAISLDDKKDAWLKAIKDDGMPWVQLSDLKGTKNVVVAEYAIEAIPQNFLLDPNGLIIAKNLHGERLDKTLEQFIK